MRRQLETRVGERGDGSISTNVETFTGNILPHAQDLPLKLESSGTRGGVDTTGEATGEAAAALEAQAAAILDACHMRGEDLAALSVGKLGELENRVSTALKNIQRKKAFQMAESMQAKEMADFKACCICLTQDKCVLFEPCKHLCTCAECAGSMDTCPICRKRIRSFVQVFL